MFDKFLTTIREFIGAEGELVNSNFERVSFFCKSILKSVNEYYRGFPSLAYRELEIGLESVEDCLSIPKENRGYLGTPLKSLYRLRTGKSRMFSQSEMFHIPFDKRDDVKTQRYSIPGLPCLYLGNSIFTCWEELRRPSIAEIQVARFELNLNEFNFLDLSTVPQVIMHLYRVEDSDFRSQFIYDFLHYLITWPLMLACSIVTKHEDATFKPEHIIPQLLLQWVCTKHNVDGIKYFSTRADYDIKTNSGLLINYVLPVKEVAKEGLCKKLIDKIKLTETISWELINISNPNLIAQKSTKDELMHLFNQSMPDLYAIELIKGSRVPYHQTAFGKMEVELSKMELKKIIFE